MSDTLVCLKHVYKSFKLKNTIIDFITLNKRNSTNVLKDISLTVERGQSIGLMGINGSGKSTLLNIIAGTIRASSGSVYVCDNVACLLELGSGLNLEFNAFENIRMYAALVGVDKKGYEEYENNVLNFSELDKNVLGSALYTYSTGMIMRLAFACLTEKIPELLIVDEALAVGDAAFQSKCFNRIENYKEEGMTMILVSHSPEQILNHTDYSYLIENGKFIFSGLSREVTNRYFELISKINPQDDEKVNLSVIEDVYHQNKGYLKTEMRWGDLRAKIVDFTLYNEKNKSNQTAFQSREKIKINFTIRCNTFLNDVIPGILIKTIDGQFVYGTNSLNSTNTKLKCHKSNSYSVSFIIQLALNTGDYLISLGVSEYASGEFIALDKRYDSILIHVENKIKDTGIVSIKSDFVCENINL